MLNFRDLSDNVILVTKKYGDKEVPVGDIYRYAPGYHDTRFVGSKYLTSLSISSARRFIAIANALEHIP